jgi:type II secretory pathway pseudopilin PulG
MKNKKGLILLQVIVIIAIIAFLAVAVLKFLLGRHATVTRAKRAIDTKAIIEACMAQKNIEWAQSVPADGSCTIAVRVTDTSTVNVTVDVDVWGSSPPYRVTYYVDYDNVPH